MTCVAPRSAAGSVFDADVQHIVAPGGRQKGGDRVQHPAVPAAARGYVSLFLHLGRYKPQLPRLGARACIRCGPPPAPAPAPAARSRVAEELACDASAQRSCVSSTTSRIRTSFSAAATTAFCSECTLPFQLARKRRHRFMSADAASRGTLRISARPVVTWPCAFAGSGTTAKAARRWRALPSKRATATPCMTCAGCRARRARSLRRFQRMVRYCGGT